MEGLGSAIKIGSKTKEHGALAHPGGSPYGVAMCATRWKHQCKWACVCFVGNQPR